MKKNKLIVGKITQSESELFEAIRNPEFSNIALMKVRFKGIETACIISINENKISPLAVLVNSDLEYDLVCPSGEKPT